MFHVRLPINFLKLIMCPCSLLYIFRVCWWASTIIFLV